MRSPGRRKAALEAWHLIVASAVAIAQPLFSLLGTHGVFLVAHRADAAHLLTLAFGLTLLLPAPLALIRLALGKIPSVGRLFQGLALSLLGGLAALPILLRFDQGDEASKLLLIAALLIGGIMAFGYLRWGWMKIFFNYLSPVVLLFPLLFLIGPQVRRLLWHPERAAVGKDFVSGPPIVMVVLDELALPSLLDREGRINGARFPNFARLAATSTWFRNASTVAESTEHALPALLTGRYPGAGQLPIHPDHPQNLFSLLGGSYQIDAFEPLTRLCPAGICGGETMKGGWLGTLRLIGRDLRSIYGHAILPQTLASSLPPIESRWRDFGVSEAKPEWSRRRGRQVEEQLEVLEQLEQGRLFFSHLLLPHTPWEYLPSGLTYGEGRGNSNTFGMAKKGFWGRNPWLVLQAQQRYLLQLVYVDRILGQMLDRLEGNGQLDSSLLVVTADHGAVFEVGEHRRRSSAHTLADVVPVPLWIKLPGQREGRVSDRNVESVDILPTLLDVLGAESAAQRGGAESAARPEDVESAIQPLDGVSVFGPEPPGRAGKTLHTMPAFNLKRKILPPILFDAVRKAAGRHRTHLGESMQELYALGPRPQWIGRRVESLGLGEERLADVKLLQPEHYEEVDASTGFLPARVLGRSHEGREHQPRFLAVAVDGVVRATTFTFQRLRGVWMFTAMVPEESFTKGRHEIRIFDITEEIPKGYLDLVQSPRIYGTGFEPEDGELLLSKSPS